MSAAMIYKCRYSRPSKSSISARTKPMSVFSSAQTLATSVRTSATSARTPAMSALVATLPLTASPMVSTKASTSGSGFAEGFHSPMRVEGERTHMRYCTAPRAGPSTGGSGHGQTSARGRADRRGSAGMEPPPAR